MYLYSFLCFTSGGRLAALSAPVLYAALPTAASGSPCLWREAASAYLAAKLFYDTFRRWPSPGGPSRPAAALPIICLRG